MDPVRFGQFLSAQRKKRNMTQGELARKIHVSSSAVSKWERGLCLPEMSKLKDLAEILDLSLIELINCEKSRESYTPQQVSKAIDTTITVSSSQKIKAVILGITGFILAGMIIYARFIGYQYTIRPLRIYYGYSERYTREEIEQAYRMVIDEFKNKMDDRKLLELDYAGDYYSQQELAYQNSLQSGMPFTGCIVVRIKFITAFSGNAVLNNHTVYTWQWPVNKDYFGNWSVRYRSINEVITEQLTMQKRAD